MMYLDMALSALGGDGAPPGTQGNTTSNRTIAGGNTITTGHQNGIPPVGGTDHGLMRVTIMEQTIMEQTIMEQTIMEQTELKKEKAT